MATCSMKDNMFSKGSIGWAIVVLIAIVLGLFIDWSAKCKSN